MTDNEIIKALEICKNPKDRRCTKCCYYPRLCIRQLKQDALDLIKQLQAEKRKLEMILEAINNDINPLPFEIDFDKAIRIAKSEAIKEFAERLVAIYENDKNYARPTAHTLVGTLFCRIDNLVKEMVGEEDGN